LRSIALEKKDKPLFFYIPKKFDEFVLLTAAVFYSTDWQAHSKSSQPCGEAAIFQGDQVRKQMLLVWRCH